MQVNELKRVKELEEENARLNRKYADLSLVKDVLKQVLEKKYGGLYNADPSPCRWGFDSVWIELLGALEERHPGIGFYKAYHRIRHKGNVVNKKILYRIYAGMGLNIRRRKRKRLPARVKQALFVPDGPNKVWSMDFMHDSFWDGKPFRVLNIVDDFNRQALRIEPDTSLTAERVVHVLNQLKESRGVPAMIGVDNGPELVSIKLDLWCRENGVTLPYIQPGKPTQIQEMLRHENPLGNIEPQILVLHHPIR